MERLDAHPRQFTAAAKRWTKFDEISGVAFASILELAKGISRTECLTAEGKIQLVRFLLRQL